MNNKSRMEFPWWAAPYVMMMVSLVGFLCVLVNPYCWFSPPVGECSWFAFDNDWKPYRGMAAGLQLFATGFLVAAASFSWPALRTQIACCAGKQVVVGLKFCFYFGYPFLLFGIWTDMYSDNSALATNIVIAFVALIMAFGWVLIIFAVWIAIEVARLLYKKLRPVLQPAWTALRDSVGRLRRNK